MLPQLAWTGAPEVLGVSKKLKEAVQTADEMQRDKGEFTDQSNKAEHDSEYIHKYAFIAKYNTRLSIKEKRAQSFMHAPIAPEFCGDSILQ